MLSADSRNTMQLVSIFCVMLVTWIFYNLTCFTVLLYFYDYHMRSRSSKLH